MKDAFARDISLRHIIFGGFFSVIAPADQGGESEGYQRKGEDGRAAGQKSEGCRGQAGGTVAGGGIRVEQEIADNHQTGDSTHDHRVPEYCRHGDQPLPARILGTGGGCGDGRSADAGLVGKQSSCNPKAGGALHGASDKAPRSSPGRKGTLRDQAAGGKQSVPVEKEQVQTAADIKNWNKEELSKLNLYLNENGIKPVYIGSKNDREYIESISGTKFNIAGDFGLRDIPEIASYASWALSMCTGPLHILGTVENLPIIAIYGPSDPLRWAPKNAIVVQSSLPCVPCLNWAKCKREKGNTCMDEIKFERVKNILLKYALIK